MNCHNSTLIAIRIWKEPFESYPITGWLSADGTLSAKATLFDKSESKKAIAEFEAANEDATILATIVPAAEIPAYDSAIKYYPDRKYWRIFAVYVIAADGQQAVCQIENIILSTLHLTHDERGAMAISPMSPKIFDKITLPTFDLADNLSQAIQALEDHAALLLDAICEQKADMELRRDVLSAWRSILL